MDVVESPVTARGAVLLGKYVACDAFDEVRPLRVYRKKLMRVPVRTARI